jgi:uncharacterized protein YndB with AHSA1/START domain
MHHGQRVPEGMSISTQHVAAPPSAVWEALSDGWLYPLWVVGAARMRQVDDHWPEVGARLHHSVGIWPALINDQTEVLESIPDQLLRLKAKGWPAGEAEVVIRLRPSGSGTEVEIEEDVAAGPGRLMPSPLRQPMLKWRNTETLRRLGYIAERRVAEQRVAEKGT